MTWLTAEVAHEQIAELRRIGDHERVVPRRAARRRSGGQWLSRIPVPALLHRAPNAMGCNV